MQSPLKYLIHFSLFVGAMVTPIFAFDEVTSSEASLAVRTSPGEDNDLLPSNELRKIAAEVRNWDGKAIALETGEESTDAGFESDTSDESEADEDETEITKLDQELFTYVMSKYIKRVRLS